MRSRVDERLRCEVQALDLRFECEHCAHFCDNSRRCSHGYPTDLMNLSLDAVDHIEFCKDFELG